MTRRAVVVVACVWVAACGDDRAGDDAGARARSAGDAATIDTEAATAQCRAILDRSWSAIEPAVARLRIADPAAVERRYKSDADYLERCATLSPPQRDCLATAADPVVAIADCRINVDREPGERLIAIDVAGDIQLFARAPLAPEDAAKALARLRGKWVNDWRDAGQVKTWTIGADGRVDEVVERGGTRVDKSWRIELVAAGRMTVHFTDTSSQSFVWFQPERRTFYASSNLDYDFYPMPDDGELIVRNGDDYIFFDGERCQVIHVTGRMIDGTCGFGRYDGKRVLEVRYAYPATLGSDGDSHVQQIDYYVIDGHLVDERLVHGGKFTRAR